MCSVTKPLLVTVVKRPETKKRIRRESFRLFAAEKRSRQKNLPFSYLSKASWFSKYPNLLCKGQWYSMHNEATQGNWSRNPQPSSSHFCCADRRSPPVDGRRLATYVSHRTLCTAVNSSACRRYTRAIMLKTPGTQCVLNRRAVADGNHINMHHVVVV